MDILYKSKTETKTKYRIISLKCFIIDLKLKKSYPL